MRTTLRFVWPIAVVLAFGLAGCARGTAERNKAAARGYLTEVIGAGDMSRWSEYLADTVRFNGNLMTRQSMERILAQIHAAFPDYQVTVEDQVAEGDQVASRVMFQGTHLGHFMGIPASGRAVSYQGMAFDRFENGRLVEAWHEADLWGLALSPHPKLD